MQIDVKYYLSQQIHPIVTRLCEPIEGIDGVHIATCLGLDPAGFKAKAAASSSAVVANAGLTKQQQKLQIYLNEIERYKGLTPFKYTCPSCKTESVWKDLFIKDEVSHF